MTAALSATQDIDHVLAQLDGVGEPRETEDDTSWMACCPAHDDSTPSLSVTAKADGTVLAHCFAGCSQSDLRAAMWLPARSAGIGEWMPGGIAHEATYDYVDADGELLFQVLRGRKDGKKEFRQRVPDPGSRSGWKWSVRSLSAVKRAALYVAPVVAGAIEAGETVFVVEGEKDVHSALAHGLMATCNAGGADKFTKDHARQLEGAHVVVVADRDDPGRKHASKVRAHLTGLAASVRVVEAAEGKDLTDHLDAGSGVEDLVEVDPETGPESGSEGAEVIELRGFGEWGESPVSERLVDDVRDRYRWVSEAGWHSWTGRVWRPRSDKSFIEEARRFGKAEVARTLQSGGNVSEAAKLLGRGKVVSIADFAKGQLECPLVDFDIDPDIFVAGDCVVDLRKGDRMDHDPARLVTKSSGVNYRPGATHPDWDEALLAVTPQEADWLQVRLGQAITGHPPDDDVMPVLKGGGENGKSTLLGAVLDATGDYSLVLPKELLMGNPGDHPTKKMVLKGLRLGVNEETPEGRYLDTTALKEVLGTPYVTGHFMRQDDITFQATHSLFLSTNPEILIDEVDNATWRRFQKLEFSYRYRKPWEDLVLPADRRGDPGLRPRVRKGRGQQEAVLAWLVEGARRWYANDCVMPSPPLSVADATRVWRRKSDHWLAFAEDHLVVEDGYAIWIEDVHHALNAWQKGRSQKPWGPPLFRGRLESNPWIEQPGVYVSGRTRLDDSTILSRPEQDLPPKSPPKQGQYLVGVRFRSFKDDEDAGDGAASVPPAAAAAAAVPDRSMPVITDLDDRAVAR